MVILCGWSWAWWGLGTGMDGFQQKDGASKVFFWEIMVDFLVGCDIMSSAVSSIIGFALDVGQIFIEVLC